MFKLEFKPYMGTLGVMFSSKHVSLAYIAHHEGALHFSIKAVKGGVLIAYIGRF